MTTLAVLPFQHPTRIALVDDDAAFLRSFSRDMRGHGLVSTFVRPEEAVAEIKRQTQQTAGLDLSRRIARIGDPSRFDAFSVVIGDYELFKAIVPSHAGRILLTRKVDERHAVRAFNDETIDRYVRKDEPDMMDRIRGFVEKLKYSYFRRCAASVVEAGFREQASFLFDPVFGASFERSCAENDIVEYYLDPLTPGFIMLDGEGELLVNKVLSEMQMAQHAEIAGMRGAPGDFLDLLRSGQAMPVFPTRDGFYSAEFADSWKEWTFSTRMLDGARRYYTAVASGPAVTAMVGNATPAPYAHYVEQASA